MLKENEIYLGDCIDLMRKLQDKSIDCVITDPPYGHEIDTYNRPKLQYGNSACPKKDYGDISWNKIPTKEVFNEIFRISKNQIIFGANYFHDFLPQSNGWLVWDKRGEMKGNNFADGELIWTSFDFALRIKRYVWNGMIQQNMKNKEKRVHPCQKPVDLMRSIIQDFTKTDDIVLDPFMGGGSTIIACADMGRRYIGIEKDDRYFNIAKKRIDQFKAQMKLF